MGISTFTSITRQAAAGMSRRASLLALGAAGLTAALTSPLGAEASKKGKKKCNTQKKQCASQVRSLCAQFGAEEQECLNLILPCCDTCNVGNGVTCVFDVFANPGGMAPVK